MKTFVLGDPHGGLRAIIQVLQRARFDYANDKLICLGDVADGWSETAEALDYLIDNVKNLVYVRGNHDQWLKQWLDKGQKPNVWTMQGGLATMSSYSKHPELKEKHLKFLKSTKHYYVDDKNRLFVHGGIAVNKKAEDTEKMYLMWDRELWYNRFNLQNLTLYSEVYVGHTSIYRDSEIPANYANVWFLDTGGGWEGVLSIMNIDTKEVWQSDEVADLYPETRGRN
jgi:serine/threonine protein phosphatase 1